MLRQVVSHVHHVVLMHLQHFPQSASTEQVQHRVTSVSAYG